jgi:hypothetical protein
MSDENAPLAGTAGAIDPFLARCFWTYPVLQTVPPGTPLTFQVVVPPAVPATSLAAGYPLTGTAVSWELTGANGALSPGRDYQVLAGDLQSELLTVVFKPADGTVNVLPRLSLFYVDPTTTLAKVVTSAFSSQPYTLSPVSADGTEQIHAMITGALGVSAVKTIVEPGETAVLRVAPRPAAVPQVVTSILHDAPGVEIRGAIPLDPLVEAVMGPLTGALGRVLPGSKATLEAGAADVRRLLAEPLAIPVAIDVLGTRLTTTTAPVGVPEMALLTSLPEQGGSFAGMVPIGRWQSPFQIASATWQVQEGTADAPLCDLSPGAAFLKAFLLKPEVVPLAAGSQAGVAPTPVTVTVTLHVSFPDKVVQNIDLALPPLTLLRLPLALPALAAVFRHSFDDLERQDEQWVYLITDCDTAVFAPTRDDATRLLTRVGSALNTVVAAANLLGSEWKELLDLASAVSMLAQAMGRVPDGSVYFSPVWSRGGTITLEGDFANQISAFIWIGMPGKRGFLLGDCAKSNCIVAPKGGSPSFSSVLPTLDGTFSSLLQIPPNSADATEPSLNYNDKMNMIGFAA